MSRGSITRYGSSGGLPGWLIFLIAVAIGLGAYYTWLGVQDYVRAGGLGVTEATQRADLIASATQERAATFTAVAPALITLAVTPTPVPPCQDFAVAVTVGIVRDRPSTNAAILEQLPQGTTVCVIARIGEDGEWYELDINPRTRRLDAGYMRQDLVEALNPTPTPSRTVTRPPTVTPVPFTPTPPAPLTRP
ncbi:MAG: SH3 domain-containing protein [Anaerolineae bacterium]|jgi:hypothetical protein|nr:SH3 domain-containing protein [Anaerolineae bacterium]